VIYNHQNEVKMAEMGGLASLLDSGYKPLSDEELKKLRTDIVRNKLCSAIGKSVYYYQGLLRIIKSLIYLHFSRNGQSGEAFDALLHEATDKTTFSIFAKIYSHNIKNILMDLESIRNNIMHSDYLVCEYSVLSEKPRLDKTENERLLKKDMNLNADTIIAFTGVISGTIELVKKIYLLEFEQDENKKRESEQIVTYLESVKLKIRELKLIISKTNKEKSPNDDLIKALMYRM
jgi:hypothetical protein